MPQVLSARLARLGPVRGVSAERESKKMVGGQPRAPKNGGTVSVPVWLPGSDATVRDGVQGRGRQEGRGARQKIRRIVLT